MKKSFTTHILLWMFLFVSTQFVFAQGAGANKPTITVKDPTITLAVVDGATQKGVIGATNWVCTKSPYKFVTVVATLNPDTPDNEKAIIWTGGTPVAGDNTQIQVSRDTAAKTIVTATLGKTSASVNVWVIWSTLTVHLKAGEVAPAGLPAFNTNVPGAISVPNGQILGPVIDDHGIVGFGKMCIVGKLEPAGINAIIASGLEITQYKYRLTLVDGATSPDGTDADWTPDDGNTYPPDALDQIYWKDAPSIVALFGETTVEKTANYEDVLGWHGEAASDFVYWHWYGKADTKKTPNVKLSDLQLGTGVVDFPGFRR